MLAHDARPSGGPAHPEVSSTDVIGMRNHLVHGYDDADLNLLHSTIATDLPALVAQLTSPS